MVSKLKSTIKMLQKSNNQVSIVVFNKFYSIGPGAYDPKSGFDAINHKTQTAKTL